MNEEHRLGVNGSMRMKFFMIDSVSLPKWLDDYIFNQLKAYYCPSNSDMTVIDWDKSNVLNYLGTYFPRSYAEAYCIFSEYFKQHLKEWQNRESVSVFDFGCGTGGEIIGLLTAIEERLPYMEQVEIIALDGNHTALRLFEKIIKLYSGHTNINITKNVIPEVIEDFYDLSILDTVITYDFDIIISFKAICEFVTKERFERQNAYEHIANTFLPKLKDNSIMLLVDVTTYNNVSQEWLPSMMDKGLNKADCKVIMRNEGYNQKIKVSHSKRAKDVSKVAWRIIQK